MAEKLAETKGKGTEGNLAVPAMPAINSLFYPTAQVRFSVFFWGVQSSLFYSKL